MPSKLPSTLPSKKKTPFVWLILLLLAVAAAYANSFENSLHFDDFHTVADNPAVRSLANVPRFFTDATTFSVLPANRTYRPVVSTMLAVDYALAQRLGRGGYDMVWFHVSTLALFLVLVVVLFELYRLLLERVDAAETPIGVALVGAAWFGLHPAIAETVNYVIQRGDLYCTLGCVAALWVYAAWPGGRKTGVYLLPLVLALLSKPPAAVFPVLLGVYVWYFERMDGERAGARLRRCALAMAPSLAVTAGLLVLQSAMTPKTFAPSALSAGAYRLTQPYVWLRYCGELFLPVHLNADSDLKAFAGVNAQALAGLLFFAGLGVAVWAASRRRRWYPVAFGLLWFVVTELPTSLYPLSEVENDHRMFFAFVGLVLAVVWAAWLGLELVTTAAQRVKLRPALVGVVLLALAGYAYGVRVRNAVWKTDESLWADDVAKSPENGRGLMNYALALMGRGAYPQALEFFTRALLYTPNYATLEINLGIVNGAMGSGAQAQQHFERAIALAPASDEPHAYYGRWLLQTGRTTEARAQLEQAVQLNPERLLQRDMLIGVDEAVGDIAAAKTMAAATLLMAPDDAAAKAAMGMQARDVPMLGASQWINQSLVAYREGRYADSLKAAEAAVKADPKSAEGWNNVAAAYGGLQQWDKAAEAAQQALRLNPGLQIAQNNLRWFLQQQAVQSGHGAGQAADHSSKDNAAKKTGVEYLNESLGLYQAGRYAESVAAAHKAVALEPGMAEAWNNIAAGESSQRHWDAAVAAAQRAIALKPDFQLAKNNLAWAESQKKAGMR